ncbi:MAG: heme-copper oxidase subunit III [Thermoflexales bacterium]|nr:heme-copper oxidase subunit III [Thermoflexales bacterium]
MSDVAATQDHALTEAGSMPGVDNRKFGVWLFIASEVMFFMALIGMYLAYRGQPSWADFHHALDIPLTAVNTFILLTSSLMVVLAVSAAQQGHKRNLTAWMIATVVLGTIFVSIQAFEYSKLGSEGHTLSSSLAGNVFFTLTGFHGLHVIIGVLWGVVVLLRAARGGFNQRNFMGVELFGLYWHFVDVVWILLFTIIYLI